MCSIKKKREKRNIILYKVEALSKQRAHTIKGNAHTHTRTDTHTRTHTHMPSVFFFLLNEDEDAKAAAADLSARVHAEQLDPMRAPVEADSRVEDQGPDVRDEEILRLVFLHIFKLELWELLFAHEKRKKDSVNEQGVKCYHSRRRTVVSNNINDGSGSHDSTMPRT